MTLIPPGFKKDSPQEFIWLMNSGFDHTMIITDEQVDWAYRWLRTVPPDDPRFRSGENWNFDLLQLGLLKPGGGWDRPRIRRASRFVWSHEGEEPSFVRLLKHLREADGREVAAKKAKGKAVRKKSKIARKSARKTKKRK